MVSTKPGSHVCSWNFSKNHWVYTRFSGGKRHPAEIRKGSLKQWSFTSFKLEEEERTGGTGTSSEIKRGGGKSERSPVGGGSPKGLHLR